MNIGAHVAIQVATQAAANMAAAQSRVLSALREAGATSPSTAMRITLDSSEDESTLARLLESDQVRIDGAGRYYINPVPPTFNRRKRVLALACALLLIVLAVLTMFVLARSSGGGAAAQ